MLGIRQHAEKIVVQYKVAAHLSLPFGDIDVKDPYNLLLFMLLHGKALFPIIDAFINHYQLNYAKVINLSRLILYFIPKEDDRIGRCAYSRFLF